jgi:hypothetical protein
MMTSRRGAVFSLYVTAALRFTTLIKTRKFKRKLERNGRYKEINNF